MHSVILDNSASLWDFSAQLYARPGVADACLRLQDEHGANVNLVLWCVWLGHRGLALDAARLRNAQKRIHGWDEHYVAPLRQLRRRMKVEFGVIDADIEPVRQQIKHAELLAEKYVQSLLETLSQPWDDGISIGPSAANENVSLYLGQLNISDSSIAEFLSLIS